MKKNYSSMMRIAFLMLCFIISKHALLNAQVSVSGSTGADGPYTTLKAAFDALNSNTNQTGNTISISLTGNTTESATAVLNQPTGGSWTSLTISPSGGNAVTVSGALAFPLVALAGADNVIIDGINNGGNTLTISNTSTSNTGASTIVFYGDATSNTIQNCTIQGSSTSTTLATIGFSSGLITGNDNNTITNCTITSAGSNLPYNAIGSAGASTSVDNSGITISNNNIQDYYSPDSASSGIYVVSNSSAWTITGNKFFQTAPRSANLGATYRAIRIVTASGGGYTINNNTIGFSSSTGSGVTIYNGNHASRFVGIELTASSVLSNIQGNKLGGIVLSTTSGATTAPGIFSGISVLSGKVNIGTTTGNRIGDASSTGSIAITTTTTAPYIAGIYVTSSDTVTIQNDTIGSILTGGTASIGYSFYGINTKGSGTYTISNNLIGSTSAPNSITIGVSGTTTTGVCKFYGINNAATGTVSITGNTIQNCSVYGTGASLYNGVLNTGGAGTLSIVNNNIISGSNSGTAGFIGISNTAAVATANINNNVLRNHTLSSSTADFTGIENSGVITSAINIKDNQLGNSNGGLVTFSAANSGTLTAIYNTDGDDAATLTVTGNDIRGITNSSAASGDHMYIMNTVFAGSTNISNNTFTSLSVNTSGYITFISNDVTHAANTTHNINKNSVASSYTNSGGGGVVYFYDSFSLSPSTVTEIDSANNFSNLTFTGLTDIGGWRSSDGPFSAPGPRKRVVDNTFRNITTGSGTITVLNVAYADYTSSSNSVSRNIISGIAGGDDITGITSASGNQNFSNNTIDSIVCTGPATITGLAIVGGTTQNVYKNKLYSLVNSDASGAADGILVDDGTTVNVYNNIIGDIRATASTYTDAIRGISVTSTTSSSTVNVYYNTVSLNASSVGTNFGTTGIYHAASSTATTAKLNLRNNIIVNNSTPAGTGLVVAFRRSSGTSGTLANYASTSNNNLFYAGTPGTNHLIYSDGTSTAQTLVAYKNGVFTAGTIATRDASSVTENPTFISTSGPNAGFLHINTSIATQIESGAQNITSYTDDYDNDIRQGNGGYLGTGNAPDIGADEFNGVILDVTAPSITYTPLTNSSCISTDTLIATITDATGINTTPGTKPRIWYKKTTNQNVFPANNTSATDGWKYTEAINSSSPFTFVIDYSLIFGSVASGDSIQYFVVAQDAVTPTPNLGINSGTFANAQTTVALGASAFPLTGTINKYKLLTGISGTVTVGSGGTYPTLTGTGGLFQTINNGGLAGNVTATILGNITETGAVPLNTIGYGCASHYTLTIKPAASTTPTLSGSNSLAIIKLNGADYVTIDGSNSGGTSQDLTIANNNAGTSSAAIWIADTLSDGATNITIKNCVVMGNSPTTTLGGIVSSSGSTLGGIPTTSNSHNTIQNNNINTCAYGIALVGTSTGDSSNVVTGNIVGSATPGNKIGYKGLFISNQTDVAVTNNTVKGVTTSGSSTTSGIMVVGAISGGSVSSNIISDIKNTNLFGYGSNGILLTASSTASNLTVSNNMIFDVASYGYASGDGVADNGYGLIVDDGGGYNIYFNSIHMNTNQTDDGLPAAFNVTDNVTTPGSLDVRDNIFANTQTVGTDRFSIICEASNTVFSNIDYNVYFADTAPNLGYFMSTNAANLVALQTATGMDSSSINVAPVFTSATDLHLVVNSNCSIDKMGTPITGITTDIDTDPRNATHPDIGADEFTNPDPSLSSTLTPSALCSGDTFSYTPTSNTSGATFAWVRNTISGITEAGTSGSGNVSEPLTNTTTAAISVTYEFTVSANGCSNVQNVVVSVSPPPSLSSTLTPTGICSGALFTYTPQSNTPGATFSWSRAVVSGISNAAATGTGNVSETLTNTSLIPVTVIYAYTVTSNGCSGSQTQNVQVTVSPVPSLSSSLSPTTCSGSVFNYTATSTTPGVSYTWTRATVNGISEPGTAGSANVNEVLTNTTTSAVTTTYIYHLNSSGCAGNTQNVVVTVYPIPTVNFAAFSDSICLQSSPLTLSGGSPSGGTYAGPGVNNGVFTPSVAGIGQHTITYSVTANGCTNAASQTVNVSVCAGVDEYASENIRFFPNPASGSFTISISNSNVKDLGISILDIQGKEVFTLMEKNLSSSYNKQIDVSSLAKGIYYLKLNVNGIPKMNKLILD